MTGSTAAPRGRYRKIEVRTWSDERFRSLSPMPPSGQGLWFFLLTGPHTGPIPGLFRAGRAAMAEELDWEQEAFDEAFRELCDKGMVKADLKARLVWLPNAIKHNRPESPNVVKGWKTEFDLLPECPLKEEALAALKALVCSMGDGFAQAFLETFEGRRIGPKGLQEGLPEEYGESGTGAGTGTGAGKKPRAKPSAGEGAYTAEFEQAWAEYPARPGASKADAFKAWNARLNAGKTADAMLAGVRRYKAYVVAVKTEPQFIKQPATFFGPGLHFELEWALPRGSRSIHDLSGMDYRAGQAGGEGGF